MRTKGAAVATATNWYVQRQGNGDLELNSCNAGSQTLSSLKLRLSVSRVSAGASGLCGPSSTPFSCLSSTYSIPRQVCGLSFPYQASQTLTYDTANRSLEDLDEYYRTNPSLIVVKDPHAISTKMPGVRAHTEKLDPGMGTVHVDEAVPEKSLDGGQFTR